MPTEYSPKLFTLIWKSGCSFNLYAYLDTVSQHALELTCQVGKKLRNIRFNVEFSLFFFKDIVAINTDVFYSDPRCLAAKREIVEKFFTSHQIARLHPIALTVLFNFLDVESVKSCFWRLPEDPKWKIIDKIALYFFSSNSMQTNIEHHALYPTFKVSWDWINKNPGDFAKKLIFLQFPPIFFYIYKAAYPADAEKYKTLKKRDVSICNLPVIDCCVEWMYNSFSSEESGTYPQPNTSRPISQYSTMFEDRAFFTAISSYLCNPWLFDKNSRSPFR